MEKLLEFIRLQIQILTIQLQIILLKRKLTIPNLPKPEGIAIHHSGGDWDFEQVNRHHTEKWGFISSLGYGIGYQYWISYSGRRTQARRDNEKGAHTVSPNKPFYYNEHYIGICGQGNFDIEKPTPNQLNEFKKLIDELKEKYGIPNNKIIAHREVAPTSCCGKYLFAWLVKNYPNQKVGS